MLYTSRLLPIPASKSIRNLGKIRIARGVDATLSLSLSPLLYFNSRDDFNHNPPTSIYWNTAFNIFYQTFQQHRLYMATKMDLDFLLAPNTKPYSRMSGSEGRSSRGDSARRDHPTPPSGSTHHRRMNEHSSHSRASHESSLRGASQKDSKSSQGKTSSKTKNTKSSSSSQKPSSSENRPHVCGQCGRPFYKQEQLKRHVRLVHENWRPFKCLFCEITFGTKQNLQVHFSTRKHRHRVETLQATNPEAAQALMRQQHRL